MAYHYLGDIQHVTCQTATGKRRSPLSDISYNSGQTLKDETTGQNHHRKHTDGTNIIATDIVSSVPCDYGDTSVSSALRRERMYNELYQLNKVNAERIYWKTTIALPNEFDNEQIIKTANEIAMSFSAYFGRPVDYSVHRKPATKKRPANCHVHIAVPERKYVRGKWGAKSVSYYINKDGTLNTQKQYKDENGNDVREPRVPKGEKPIYATDKDGHKYCVNQVKGSSGSLKWKMQNFENLTKENISWMHEEIDRIQNRRLEEAGLEKVTRNDARTTKELKKLGVKAQHIGKRDNEAQGESYYEKVAINEEYKRIANAMNSNYEKQDKAEKKLKDNEQAIETAQKRVDSAKKIFRENNAELQQEKELAIQATVEYVENELQPEEQFVTRAVTEYNKAVALANENLDLIKTIADEKINAINNVLIGSADKEKTEKEKVIEDFLKVNKKHWKSYRDATNTKAKSSVENIKRTARKKWKRCPGWTRCEFVRQTAGTDSAVVYKKYLELKNESVAKPTGVTTLKVVTCEEAVADVIESLPRLKSQMDKSKSAVENARSMTTKTLFIKPKQGEANTYLPPANEDVLTLWASIPDRIISMMEENPRTISRPLQDYHPKTDEKIFEDKLRAIEKQEAENEARKAKAEAEVKDNKSTKTHATENKEDKKTTTTTVAGPIDKDLIAKHRADYNASAQHRLALLIKLREETAKAYAKHMFKEESKGYPQYRRDSEPINLMLENLEATKKETPYNYIAIEREEKAYERALARFRERYPNHPRREPNLEVNQKEATELFVKMRADLVKKKIEELNLPVPQELIRAYDDAAEKAQALWRLVEEDKKASGTQDTMQKSSQKKTKDQKTKTKTIRRVKSKDNSREDDGR